MFNNFSLNPPFKFQALYIMILVRETTTDGTKKWVILLVYNK